MFHVCSGTQLASCYNSLQVFILLLKLSVLNILGVRSLANASRARQFNRLNPPGVGWVKFVSYFKVRVGSGGGGRVVAGIWSANSR